MTDYQIINIYLNVFRWQNGLISSQQYNDYLDELFIQNNENELLFELEICSDSPLESLGALHRYFLKVDSCITSDEFGKILFAELKKICSGNEMNISDFADMCYSVWCNLPDFVDRFSRAFLWLCRDSDEYNCMGFDERRMKIEIEKSLDFFEK